MNNIITLAVIGFIGCLTQFGADIYTPSLPAIASNLNANINAVQYTLALYMAGTAISQLFYGPLSEGIGRKKTMIIGLMIYIIGSLMATFAQSITVLILARLIQGLGVGANASLWRAIFRDSFEGEQMAKYGSYLGTVIILIMPLAPLFGGYFQQYISWRASFVFLLCYALITLGLMLFCYKESNTHHKLERLNPRHILGNYGELLRSRVFIGYSLCSFASYGAFFAWFVTGSVLIVHHLGYTPVQFAWISFAASGICISLGGLLHGKLVVKYGSHVMLSVGWSMMLLAGIIMLILYLACGLNLWAFILPVALFFFFSSFIWSNIFAGAFKPFGHIAGNAGALYGCFQIGGASVFGAILSQLPTESQLGLTLMMLISTLCAFFIYTVVVPKEAPTKKQTQKLAQN